MATIERLKRRPDFLAAAEGRRFHTERMTAQGRVRGADEIRDGAPATGLHLGFTITKRVGHATERNRIRRRLRAAVAELGPDLAALPADIVLIARRPAIDAAFDTLKDDLRRAIPAVAKPRGQNDKPRGPSDKSRGPNERPQARRRGKGGDTGGGKPTASGTIDGAAAPRAPSSTPNACDGGPDGQ